MFHLLAFQGTQPISAAFTALPPVPDQQVPTNQNNQFILPGNVQVMMAAVGGARMGNSRINSPSLRLVALPAIYPLIASLNVPSRPYLDNRYSYGPVLPKNDPLELDTSNTNGAGTDVQWGLIWLGDSNFNTPQGPRIRLHATSAFTGNNNAWNQVNITFDQVLSYGTYQVVGFQATGANLVAARLVFVGGGWRPGCLAGNALTDLPNPIFLTGMLGTWGQFESNAQPSVELFTQGAGVTQDYFVDVVKVA